MSLLNPGPNSVNGNMSVYYQNVRGLININSIRDTHPTFNMTKLFEFQSHVYNNKPDIVILNETWLKPTIGDSEILNGYQIFRLDYRSNATHPPDLSSNTDKFKRYDGGVLIAFKADLCNTNPKIIKSHCAAELLSIEFSLPNKKKVCITTCYRVGTLGVFNHSEIHKKLFEIAKNRKIKHHIVVGDFNLDTVDWNGTISSNGLHKKFVDTFLDLGLSQLINQPTHELGNTLDLLLTDYPAIISDVKVCELNECVKSDHAALCFSIRTKVPKLVPKKRTIFNYSKADWDSLNFDLRHINWNSLLDSQDPDTAWVRFKQIFLRLKDKHIPTISTKNKSSPPWFDSDIHKLCIKKEKFCTLFKQTGNPEHEKKYKAYRKSVKSEIKSKMRANFTEESNPNTISKKFWAFVKSSSNSSRIPDSISCKGSFRNNSVDKANMFNNFFHEQFSDKSHYNIDCNFSNDPFHNFKIYHKDVRKMLSAINPNKSCGPDGISGKDLKNCAVYLSYPLALIFNRSVLVVDSFQLNGKPLTSSLSTKKVINLTSKIIGPYLLLVSPPKFSRNVSKMNY